MMLPPKNIVRLHTDTRSDRPCGSSRDPAQVRPFLVFSCKGKWVRVERGWRFPGLSRFHAWHARDHGRASTVSPAAWAEVVANVGADAARSGVVSLVLSMRKPWPDCLASRDALCPSAPAIAGPVAIWTCRAPCTSVAARALRLGASHPFARVDLGPPALIATLHGQVATAADRRGRGVRRGEPSRPFHASYSRSGQRITNHRHEAWSCRQLAIAPAGVPGLSTLEPRVVG